jgi:hypothetical protein
MTRRPVASFGVPNSQEYEDWIKDEEGSGKDVENE